MGKTIHILDADVLPKAGESITVHCGSIVLFHPIRVYWTDGRVCQKCLVRHRLSESTRYTCALPETHDPEQLPAHVFDHWVHADTVGPIADQSAINAVRENERLIR